MMGLGAIPAVVRDLTCLFSQHKILTKTGKWAWPQKPEGMQKPGAIQ